MCGITGAYYFKNPPQDLETRLAQANQSQVLRGPDDGEVRTWSDGMGMGHRRLSIIDVSTAACQPMSEPSGRFTIAFNGEIYNYLELKEKYLTAEEQSRLKSHSDTEVLLLLYTKMGEECFPLLDGFFALAIHDAEKETLTLARDRFGKKPLLIYQDEEKLLFASEMKALFAAGIPRKINLDVLPLYLQLTYVPEPYSMVQGVRKLRPGHYAVVKGGEITEQAYYTLELSPEDYQTHTYESAKQELVKRMDAAVQKRLISDVPLGAFLSGGIDSSVVVALAAQHKPGLQTFSIGYKDHPFFDETHYAAMVAKKYKTDHTVFSLSNDDFLEHVNGVLDYIDEPFADSSALPEYILCNYTKREVSVSLSGDGGDEVFAGYNKHLAEWRMRAGGLKAQLVKAGAPLWSLLPQSRNNKLTNKFRQLHRFASGARLKAADRYWRWASFVPEAEGMALLHPTVRQKIDKSLSEKVREEFTGFIKGTDFNEVLLADMRLVLISDMLVKVDRMSMANSLEVRSPFLDQKVVEFSFGLPATYKIRGTLKKSIVQDAFRSYLPEEIYDRPKKGFEIPLLDWFRKELWGLINDDLLSESFVAAQQLFDVGAIRTLKAKLLSQNPGDSHVKIWSLIVFQYWWKKWMQE